MGRDGTNNFYDVLGVKATASEAEIRSAYRTKAKRLHPDVAGGTVEGMAELNEAYAILSDNSKRARYDSDRRKGPQIPAPTTRPRPRPAPMPFVDPFEFYSKVFVPTDARVTRAIESLLDQLDELSGDPYDDQLAEAFEAQVNRSSQSITQALRTLGMADVPGNWDSAISLYEQGLRQIEDALEEFETFSLNYNLDHIVDGRSIMLAAAELLAEARDRLRARR